VNPILLIPARMDSTRLPGKPLADIAGEPMIVQVMKRAQEADCGLVLVACAEQEIADSIEQAGGKAILTNPDHPSGSDRIYEALQQADPEGKHDIVINVQGDLPTLDPKLIRDVLLPFTNDAVDVTTLATKINDDEERTNPNVVKAVVAWQEDSVANEKSPAIGRALYFTRASAPYGEGDLYHHIGLYGYRRAALERFVTLPPSPLELREKLEQLRVLENGMRIDVVEANTVPLGVDTAADLEKARTILMQSA